MTDQTNLELIWASSGGVTDPGDTKYATGWVSEIPSYQNFNFVLQAMSSNILSLAEKGTYNWEAGIDYEVGASVTESGEKFYCVTNNIGIAPSTDTTSSYWIKTPFYGVPSGAPKKEQGLALRQVNSRTGTNWTSSDITIDNEQALIQLNTTSVGQTNWLLGNVSGSLVAVDAGTSITADSRSLVPSTTYSHKIFHEGNLPTASQISGVVEEAPIDGVIYGRSNEQWTPVVTTSVSDEPPPASIGAGTGWYNLADGNMYIDINDGDSSQWVPANPPQVVEGTGSGGGSVGPVQTEEVILAAGQISVLFSVYSTEDSSFYISGVDVDSGRLPNSAFTVVDVSEITLTESYPAGTEIKLVRNEVIGEQPGIVSEVVSLTSGQTTVVFTNQTTEGAGFYLSGVDADSGRLAQPDYYVVDSNSIELYQSYPEGTTVTLLRNTSEAGAERSAGTASVKDFGAVGDGVTDDTAAIQAAIDSSSVLHIPSSQYKISSSLNITSSIEIRMDKETVIDGTSIPASVVLGDSPILNCRGSISTADYLTASVLEGTSDFTVASAASYSIGDTVLVRSNAYYSTGVTTGNSRQGWITRIQNIVANTITLDVKSYAPLLTGDSASIAKISPISVNISGGKVLGNGVGYGHSGIKVAYGVNSKIENVLADGCEDVGIELGYTINSNVVNVDISNCTSSATLGNTGYGVLFADGAEGCSVTTSRFKNCRHSVAGGGRLPTRYITVDNNVLTDGGRGTNDLDCHEPCFYWTISNNRIVNGEGTSGGMIIRGKDIKVLGNTIVCKDKSNVGIKVSSFIVDTSKQTNVDISNNTIEGCSAGILLDTSYTLIEGVTIEGNSISNSSYAAIYVTDTKKLKIDNNRIDGTSEGAGTSGSLIRLIATTLGDVADVSICGNILTNGIQGLVRFSSVKGITINSNNMSNSSDVEGCIYVDVLSEDIVACSNEFKDAYGFIQGPVSNAVISNNKGLIDQAGGWTDFVRLHTAGGTSVINGNVVTGAYRKAVYVTDHERCIVTANIFIDAENGTPIDFGTAVVTVNANNLI